MSDLTPRVLGSVEGSGPKSAALRQMARKAVALPCAWCGALVELRGRTRPQARLFADLGRRGARAARPRPTPGLSDGLPARSCRYRRPERRLDDRLKRVEVRADHLADRRRGSLDDLVRRGVVVRHLVLHVVRHGVRPVLHLLRHLARHRGRLGAPARQDRLLDGRERRGVTHPSQDMAKPGAEENAQRPSAGVGDRTRHAA